MLLEEIFLEGVHDPSIFKAIFFVGSPGSGKSYVEQVLGLRSLGFVSLDSDIIFSLLLIKNGLSLKMPPDESQFRGPLRDNAKNKLAMKQAISMNGRLGLVIQGTGYNMHKTMMVRDYLRSLGYEDMLVIVHCSDVQTALSRNTQRERTIPEQDLINKWTRVSKHVLSYKELFPNCVEIDNNSNTITAKFKEDIRKAYVKISTWARVKPSNRIAQEWITNRVNTQ